MKNNAKSLFETCYRGTLQCKESMFTVHGKEVNKMKFLVGSFVYGVFLFIKILFARFLNAPVLDAKMNFSWISYQSRFNDYKPSRTTLNYHYKEFSKEEISILKYVSLKGVWSNLQKLNSLNLSDFQRDCDSFWFRFVNAVEFELVNGVFRLGVIKHVVIAGLNDRMTINVCELGKKYGVKVTVLQHGAFTKFTSNFLTIADEFCYIYEFSLPYLGYFFRNSNEIKLIKLPLSNSKKELADRAGDKPFVAYATTPTNVPLNISIIEEIKQKLSSDIELVIYPHPRESLEVYKYLVSERVEISRKKYKAPLLFLTRISSIGVEMAGEGQRVCFVNAENHCTDFLDSGKFDVIQDVSSIGTVLEKIINGK